ncbi:hypothetical protein [uncultured Brevundimonas sp.]|uniref:hypothetical protein n=1 Tax=uncultured Brevundimonas sp. TaxID=213418 RepID=UPI00263277B9|nr:hypothetical protein [uncultured Brevundimonas sp.]
MAIYSSAEFVKALKKTPENFYVIHYSCQSLFDDNEALSPRITSIAVSHYATDQVVSFSTHSVAEELRIAREDVLRRFDEVEAKLLQDFYAFVRERRDKFWIHWNMRNLTYGFEHLEHRYRVLGGADAAVIPVERRLNLNDMLSDKYGSAYARHPKLKSLMELNGGIHRHFLTGEEEVHAFKNCEFIRMHNSTLTKVGFLQSVLEKLVKGKLRTASRGVGVMLDRAFEHRAMKVVGAAGAAISTCVAGWQLWLWIMAI